MGVPRSSRRLGIMDLQRAGLLYHRGFANAIPKTLRDHYLIAALGGQFAGGWNNLILWWAIITAIMIVVLNRTASGCRVCRWDGRAQRLIQRGFACQSENRGIYYLRLSRGFSGIGTVADMKTGSTTLGQVWSWRASLAQ